MSATAKLVVLYLILSFLFLGCGLFLIFKDRA